MWLVCVLTSHPSNDRGERGGEGLAQKALMHHATWSPWGPLIPWRSARKVAALARLNAASGTIARGDRVLRTGITRTSPTPAAMKIAGFEMPAAGGPSTTRPQRNLVRSGARS